VCIAEFSAGVCALSGLPGDTRDALVSLFPAVPESAMRGAACDALRSGPVVKAGQR
jgi:hypothetical protein